MEYLVLATVRGWMMDWQGNDLMKSDKCNVSVPEESLNRLIPVCYFSIFLWEYWQKLFLQANFWLFSIQELRRKCTDCVYFSSATHGSSHRLQMNMVTTQTSFGFVTRWYVPWFLVIPEEHGPFWRGCSIHMEGTGGGRDESDQMAQAVERPDPCIVVPREFLWLRKTASPFC